MAESRHVGINRLVVGSSRSIGIGANLFVQIKIGFETNSSNNQTGLCFLVYILENPDGKFYIGQTENLQERLHSHNRTDKIDGKYCRKNGPWIVVWSEEHPSRSSAMIREKQIKSMKSPAFHLLTRQNVPTLDHHSRMVFAAWPAF